MARLETLKDILLKARTRFPRFGKRLAEAEAIQKWADAVGPIVAKHAKVLWVRDKILWVEVDHPIWRSELHHQKNKILSTLNAQEVCFDDLYFVDIRI